MHSENPLLNLRASERLLLKLIRQYSPSRAELSQLAGLTPGAITQYCRKLLFLGLIKENEKAVKKRGQPSFHLSLNHAACCSIGITFLNEEFYLSIVDFAGNKIANGIYPYQSKTDLTCLFSQLKQAIVQMLDKKCLSEARILGVCLSVSGYVLADESRSSPWFPLLQNQPNLTALFEQHLGYPCWIENNINTIAIGEYYTGEWNQINDIVVISLDFGIGAGIISQGKLIRGGFGNAGEIGLLFPYGQPRPSWKDLTSYLTVHKLDKTPLNDLIAKQHPIMQDWLNNAKQQVLSLTLSAIAWLDPKVIVITGMLPIYIIEQIMHYIKNAPELNMGRTIAELKISQVNIEDISIGAAILPIHRLLQYY
ncbi:ROK family protein [Pasteurella multocida]|uniref:ROK family protein n=1 Tax=Pasteurella multocida TaxID=747 RepID=UPI0009F5CC5D|nr:ROK family protein [Pasteurella multocida]MCL7790650.1 ROK family protein [Pasteurella multocida]MCL7811979.1 ROK family protein [Pasteurella multocida]PNM05346.1 ROK family protein [Pasteurella multocida]HDR0923552.1 ROK family protein [Pasteurella multocida]HDR1293651.1 ROK family protein [Pasteurella multocida]